MNENFLGSVKKSKAQIEGRQVGYREIQRQRRVVLTFDSGLKILCEGRLNRKNYKIS